jgi:hypothetical protein
MPFSMDSKAGELLKDKDAVEILEKYAPGISKNPMVKLAKGMTLKKLLDMPQAKQFGITKEMVLKVLEAPPGDPGHPPDKPGCYLMKNAQGRIIYVGKAVNLRARVRSYFHATAHEHPKTHKLVREIADLEWIVVGSELEALILEMNLIKRHRPRFNVRLKDDKRFPYIKVHWADPFPKVTVTRQMVTDGSRYFGPYTSVWAVHQTLDLLRKIFPYLTCNREITGQDARACLYYDIKLCTAPCIGAISQADYRQVIDDLCQFLEGRTDPVVQRLNQAMETPLRNCSTKKPPRSATSCWPSTGWSSARRSSAAIRPTRM